MSAFEDDSNIELRIKIHDSESEPISGLFYIMLHETTHIVDYIERKTPYVELSMRELYGRSPRDITFTDEYWTDYRVTKVGVDIPYRDELSYYGLGSKPLISSVHMSEIYAALSESGFMSLYATSNWAEDFADFATFYYIVHALGGTYEISLYDSGVQTLSFEPVGHPEILRRADLLDVSLYIKDTTS